MQKLNLKNKINVFNKALLTNLIEKQSFSRGAEITYYLVLSIFPFMIIFLNVLKFTPLAQEEALNQLLIYIPEKIAFFIKATVLEAMAEGSDASLSIGAVVALWAASKGVKALIKALNEAYEIKETRSFIQLSLLSLALTVGFIVLIVSVLLGLVFAESLNNILLCYFGFSLESILPADIVRTAVLISAMVLSFTLLYKFSPSYNDESRVQWCYAWPGALFATVMWLLTSSAFSFYLAHFANHAKTYGSLWTVAILLIWLQLSATVVILGGEINATLKKLEY